MFIPVTLLSSGAKHFISFWCVVT